MDYQQTTGWLFNLKNRGAKFGIDRMRLLVEALDNPQNKFPAILVAGSNGKGSTAAMLESIYRANGKRTGLYTSPHLVRLGERVQVDRVPLGEEAICRYTERLAPIATKLAGDEPDDHPSFFEFMTAMAFLEFQERKVDIGIIEVGLGGRLDATNVVQPELSVITSISLEHTEILGDTLEKIAMEKGGIIKNGTPVVLGLMPAGAEKVLRAIAKERYAPVYSVRERFGENLDDYPLTNLPGPHQRANAALALLASEILHGKFPVDVDTTRHALQHASWAARWQVFELSRQRKLIVDATHNAEGASVVEPLLRKLRDETGRCPLVITGILGLERAMPLLAMLSRYAKGFWLVQPNQERASSFEAMENCIPADFEGTVTRSDVFSLFPQAGACALGEPGDTILVIGSVYLAGEVLGQFLAGSSGVESHLQDKIQQLPVSSASNKNRG
jgi:dihydrofolate synthase/folylpolyglutamate synthase